VEEAVLTGESTPQWKAPVSDGGVSRHEALHIKTHKHHVLFGGTKILQHTGDKGARLKCVCGVLGVGFTGCCCCRGCRVLSALSAPVTPVEAGSGWVVEAGVWGGRGAALGDVYFCERG